jgi:hypothetical protein
LIERAMEPFAVIVLALCAAAASADTVVNEDAQRVQTVIDLLKTGDVPAAVTKLGDAPQTAALAGKPDLVYVLCDRAFRYDAPKADAAARRTLSSRLVDLATAAATAVPDDDRLRWALAESIVLRERSGPRAGPDAWTYAADLLEKVHAGHPADGLPLGYAVSFLLEGACTDTDSAVALTNRADALAKKAADSQKDSPTLAATIATTQFWAARTLLASNHKLSRVELKAALETLRPFATRKVPVIEAATIWNDAVEFGQTNVFGLPEHFVMAPRLTLDSALAFDLPASSRWSFQTVAATDDVPGYDYVTEVATDGARRRQVLFRRYIFGRQYTFESAVVSIGGDNVRGIAQGLEAQSAAHVFAPGAKTVAAERKPFCKALDGYAFEVKGNAAGENGAKGDPVHLYGFVVKGKNQACYAVLVYVYGKPDELGLEMEAVVNSLHEPEK